LSTIREARSRVGDWPPSDDLGIRDAEVVFAEQILNDDLARCAVAANRREHRAAWRAQESFAPAVSGFGGRQDLGLVDVVDLQRLEHMRLDEVADTGPWPSRRHHCFLGAASHGPHQTPAPRSIPADVGGTRSSAITAAAPASSAISLAVTTPTVDRDDVAGKPH
jgi:hypothetical protein